MSAIMMIVCALVLLQMMYFLVIVTGELTLWLKSRLGEAYRNSKQHTEAVHLTASVAPRA